MWPLERKLEADEPRGKMDEEAVCREMEIQKTKSMTTEQKIIKRNRRISYVPVEFSMSTFAPRIEKTKGVG